MPRRWQVIRVELLGGGGIDCDPPPGRVLICPPATTFAQLGHAIDAAFARWDLSHLCSFTLPDGTEVYDDELAAEMIPGPTRGAIPRVITLDATVKRHVRTGDTFGYVFDLGDCWRHRCRVEALGDPQDSYGAVPDRPVAIWGWGSIPDQYGRRWDGDTGESDPPPRDPDLRWFGGPGAGQAEPPPLVDLQVVRSAHHRQATHDLLEAITGADLMPALQQVGAAVLAAYQRARGAKAVALEPYLLAIYYRLTDRDGPGDQELAELLLAAVQQLPLPGRGVPVDIDLLATTLFDGLDETEVTYLDTVTGDVAPGFAADAAMVGSDAVVDVEGPQWLHLRRPEGDHGDLVAFTDTIPDPEQAQRLRAAIQGRGAFRRFRAVVEDLGLAPRWVAFRDDRRWGRARLLLAEHGLRPD